MNFHIKILAILLILISSNHMSAQGCQNNIQWPASTVAAPVNFDTVEISGQSYAGDFAMANQFLVGETYLFTSDSLNDVITLRSMDQNTVLAFGTQPLVYTISTDTAFNIHINTPGCGSQLIGRATKMIHQLIIDLPNVGVNTASPEAALDINGTLKISEDLNTPVAGMVRYNSETQDFEGYDGMKWRSFTKSSAIWGEVKAPIATTKNCFIAEDGGPFDKLGLTMDIDGEYAAVSASYQDTEGTSSKGAVYILKKQGNSMVFDHKIQSPTGGAFSQFAQGGIDISGNVMIIGSPNEDYEQSVGTADIFELENGLWTWKVTLGNGNPNNNFHFAQDVAINNQYAAVRNLNFINGIDQIYVYKKIGLNWTLIDTVIGPSNSGTFGACLEFYENQLFVGDPNFFSATVLGGRVSIYDIDQNDNVILSDSIENIGENPGFNDHFGIELDISDGKMIIGSYGYEVNGLFNSGRAYIYARENGDWNLEKILEENPTMDSSEYGLRVSLYQNHAVVSSYSDAGRSYVYKYEGDWNLEAILMSGDQSQTDFFSHDVEIGDSLILVGANTTNINGNMHQGKVYIFCK